MFDQSQITGARIRAPHSDRRNLLESSRLSKLPSLSSRQPFSFKIPDAEAAPPKSGCLNCQKAKPRFDDSPLKESGLCRDCLALWQKLDSIINDYAESKTRAVKFASWAQKLNFGGAE